MDAVLSTYTGMEDAGSHTVCAVMNDDFLAFSKAAGNDLSIFPRKTPNSLEWLKDEPNKENDQLGVAPYAKSLSTFIKNSGDYHGACAPPDRKRMIAQIWVNSWEDSLMSKSEESLKRLQKPNLIKERIEKKN